MWTTERPKEAGFYYFRANKFDLPNEPLRVLEYAFPYEGAPLEDHVGYTVADRLELQPDCEWLRIPSPAHLAALLRLAEAATDYHNATKDEPEDEVQAAIFREPTAEELLIHEVRKYALDAVKEAQAK